MNILISFIPIFIILGFFCICHYLMTKGKLLWVFIILVSIFIGVFTYTHFKNEGEVIGIFIKGETKDYGELCGQYPQTNIVISNFTSDRLNPPFSSGWLCFDNYYPNIDKLIPGHIYKIGYSMGSRPSDCSAGERITEYYIDNINEVK